MHRSAYASHTFFWSPWCFDPQKAHHIELVDLKIDKAENVNTRTLYKKCKFIIYVWFFLAMDFYTAFCFQFSKSELCHTDIFGYIFLLHDTWWHGANTCSDFFFTRKHKSPKCSTTISKLQYICQVLLKATAATTIETSTTPEALGTWRWWLVVSLTPICPGIS